MSLGKIGGGRSSPGFSLPTRADLEREALRCACDDEDRATRRIERTAPPRRLARATPVYVHRNQVTLGRPRRVLTACPERGFRDPSVSAVAHLVGLQSDVGLPTWSWCRQVVLHPRRQRWSELRASVTCPACKALAFACDTGFDIV